MTIQRAVKSRLKEMLLPVYNLLGIPHSRPDRVVQKWYAKLNPEEVAQQRVQLIADATKRSQEDIQAIVSNYENRVWENLTYDDARFHKLYGMPPEDRVTLYTLVWGHSPTVCVETGAASGMSATMILSCLNQVEGAKLYSIDLDDERREKFGVLIPQEYRSQWELRLQGAEPVLPQLLDELGTIDFFLHDSRHTVQQMTWEYELAWRYLRPGGCLASHDIWFSTSFDSFKKAHAAEIFGGGAVGNFGFLIKAA